MKHHRKVLALLVLVCLEGTVVAAPDGRALLTGAISGNREAEYTMTVVNPFQAPLRDRDILQHPTHWKVCRLFRDGTLYLRLETSVNGKLIETYVKNESGIYGTAADGFCAEIIEVPALWFHELLHMEISQVEMDLSSFSVSQAEYKGTSCYRVIMRTPKSDAALIQITGEGEEHFLANRKNILTGRAFIREFLIGMQRPFIYSRKHYNAAGKVIFQAEAGEIDFTKPSLSLFATPKGVRGKFIERDFFASKALEKMIEKRKPSALADWFSRTWNNHVMRNFSAITSSLSIILAVVGGLCILLAITVKVRKSRS